MAKSKSSGSYPNREAKGGKFKDYNPMSVDPNKKQFEPTDKTPIRQHAQMAGDPTTKLGY